MAESPITENAYDTALRTWLESLAKRKAAFPVGQSKLPIRPYWRKGKDGDHCTADADRLLAHIGRGGNIGVIPYRVGCVVIDIDTPKDGATGHPGLAEAKALVGDKLGEPILQYETQSGGAHYWYKAEQPYGNDKLTFGDVRGGAGYVVVWDMMRLQAGLHYRYADADAIRADFIEALTPKNVTAHPATRKLDPASAPQGERNDTLNKRAFLDFQACKTPTEAANAVLNNLADALANPHPLPQTQIVTTLRSAAKGAFGEQAEADRQIIADTPGSQYDPDDWEFLWEGWLPVGALTLLGGDGGTGKGTLMARLAASVAGKKPWPDGRQSDPGRVVLVGSEDDYSKTVRKRYDAAGCPPDMWIHRKLPVGVPPYEAFRAKPLPDDVRMVIVDPLIQGMTTDANSTTQARAWAEGWAEAAQSFNVAVIGIMHTVKWKRDKSKMGTVSDVIAGSAQWVNTARSVWGFFKPEDSPGPRLLHLAKTNYDEPAACRTYQVTGELQANNVMVVTGFEESADGAKEVHKMMEGRGDPDWVAEGDAALECLAEYGLFDQDGDPFPSFDGQEVVCAVKDFKKHTVGWDNARFVRFRERRSLGTERIGNKFYWTKSIE